jgi:phosphoribosylglycinamide formyltransferase-1
MGWMSIFSPWFISMWRNRMLNVHPALLPKHGGRGMYGDRVHRAVLASGEEESGMTIHLMNEEVDAGPILIQKKCLVEEGETVASLKAKVQALEKEWYPKVLQMIHAGELKFPGGRG